MEDLDDKITGGILTAIQWNDTRTEAQNVVLGTGQALTASDPNQLGKGIAQYAANGDFYTDGGVANAYVITVIGSKQASPAYVDGLRVRFVPANDSTGASTINVAGLGVKSIVDGLGAPLITGSIRSGVLSELFFDLSNDRFVQRSSILQFSLGATGYIIHENGLIEQWGISATGGGGSVVVVFPIAFPSSQFWNQANLGTAAPSNVVVGSDIGTVTQFTVLAANGSTGVGVSGVTVKWEARGE